MGNLGRWWVQLIFAFLVFAISACTRQMDLIDNAPNISYEAAAVSGGVAVGSCWGWEVGCLGV